MNRRLLSLLIALSVVTTATFSGGFPTFAGNEDMPITEVVETVEDSIMDSVNALLEKADATASDAQEDEIPEVIVIDTEDQESKPTDIELTATAEDGTVVVLNADRDAFPYENLALEVHVVTGEEAEAASEEIDAEKPAENTAKRVTYDVQVQSNGTEVQPVDGKKVKVSFRVADAPSGADEVTVYHHDEKDGEVEEIAAAEVTDSAEAVVDSAETNVAISGSKAADTSDDDEYFEDIELENDLVVSGETDSFSFYTVDFTYDEKRVSIDGDTDHNELSAVLEQVGITDAITEAIVYMDKDCTQLAPNNTVTVDDTELFRVYEEAGTWYIDALNAFDSTHGLLIRAADAEYKVIVTDKKLLYVVKPATGVTVTVNDTAISDYFERYGSFIGAHYTKKDYYHIEYSSGAIHSDNVKVAKTEPGYSFKGEWTFAEGDLKYPKVKVCTPKVYEVVVPITVEAGTGGTVTYGGNIKVREYAPIRTSGAKLTIDGYGNTITAVPNTGYIFDHWETNPANAKQVSSNLKITAKFVKDPKTTKLITAKTAKEEWGTIEPVTSGVRVQTNSTITGNKTDDLLHSDSLTIDGETFKAVPKAGCYFAKWVTEPADLLTTKNPKITEDTVFTATFVNNNNPKTITLQDTPIAGSYVHDYFEGNSLNVPENVTLKVDGDTLKLADESITIQAKPYKTDTKEYVFVNWIYSSLTEDVRVKGTLLEDQKSYQVLDHMKIMAVYSLKGGQSITVNAQAGGHLEYKGDKYDTLSLTLDTSPATKFIKSGSELTIIYLEGTDTKTATISAVADTGYEFTSESQWIDVPTDNPFTGQSASIEAKFNEILVGLTVEASEGGSVMSGGKISARKGAKIEISGTELTLPGYGKTLQAVPDTGYVFTSWDTGGETTVSENMTIKAKFSRDTGLWADVKAVSSKEEWGTVTPDSTQKILKNKEIIGVDKPDDIVHSASLEINGVTFTATPKSGCFFTGWTSDPADALTSKKISGDTTFTANFVNGNNPKTVTLVKSIGGTYETKGFTGDSVQVPENAKIVVNGSSITFAGSFTVTAKPDENYEFVNWLDGNGTLLTGSDNKVVEDMKVRAVYRMTTSQSITINAGKGGNLVYRGDSMKTVMLTSTSLNGTKVNVDPANFDRLIITYVNTVGETVTESVDAVGEMGYKVKADGAWTGIPSSVSFTQADITANFEISNAKVNFTKDGKGEIYYFSKKMTDTTELIQTGTQVVKYGSHLLIGNDMLLEATSTDAKYAFDKWVVTPDTGRIDGDTIIKAVFNEVNDTVIVTASVNNAAYGTVYPKNPVRVEAGNTIKGSTQSAAIYLGNETFTAVAAAGLTFDRWEISGAEWEDEITGPITLKAYFVDYSGIGGRNFYFATPTNGTYQNSFQGDKLVVPQNGASYKVDGDTIVFGNGKAYSKALPDKDYVFSGWADAVTGNIIEDGTSISDIQGDNAVVATFTYTRDVDEKKETPKQGGGSSSGGSGSGSTLPGDSNSKNYHAENTYGSMDAPISDGMWEHLSDDTWKYNWRIPMVSAWGCIVNPYANAGAGQQPHGWFFFDPYGIMLTGWRLVDGKWYYLEPISNGCRGQLYTSTTTPDGYKVDANGAWIR